MIKFNEVSKIYNNNINALDNISFELNLGKVVGILGPNGSGKTTLLKLMQGYLKPSKGTIEIFGEKIGANTKANISYLPDVSFIPKDYTILEAKHLWSKFYDDFNEEKFYKILDFMDLRDNQRISDLSKGMVEKFHLTLILSRDAKIFIIDEPIAGVDLVAREKILEAIFSNISKDKLLIITTHLIDEMENIFDDVIFINNGKIVLEGNVDDLRLEKGKPISEIFKDVYIGSVD